VPPLEKKYKKVKKSFVGQAWRSLLDKSSSPLREHNIYYPPGTTKKGIVKHNFHIKYEKP